MTKKTRFIEKLDALSAGEKREITDFFTKHPNYENRIDWNSRSLTYRDFEEALSLVKNSSQNVKPKIKTDLRPVFEKCNCEIIKETEDFLIVVPFDWECAVFFVSFKCGGERARWCIGESDNAAHWNDYLTNKNVFFLVFFMKRDPVFEKKAAIQYHIEDGTCTLWLQNNIRLYKLSNIFKSLNIPIEFIQKNAERLLGRIHPKEYFFFGSNLMKYYRNHEIIDIPSGVTTIDSYTFAGCKSLTTVNIPESVTTIEFCAFAGCKSLSSINVGKQNPRFSSIDGVLFDKIKKRILCYPAEKKDACYMIPADVTAIDGNAFEGCKSLAAIDIPDSVTVIGDGPFSVIGDKVFSGCKNLRSINVGNQNPRFSDVDGVLIDKIEKRILCYPAGKQDASYTIPAGIITIGDKVFSGCENLVFLDIPDTVTVIGDNVFSDCKYLRSINVGKQNPRFSSIDGVLFDKIENRILRYPARKQDARYAIPAGIIAIGDKVFSDCENLVTLDIPDSVIAIGDFVFSGCENLKEAHLSRKTLISKYTFDDIEVVYTD
jgi:hypothetical protein